jgi:hypothetical protein
MEARVFSWHLLNLKNLIGWKWLCLFQPTAYAEAETKDKGLQIVSFVGCLLHQLGSIISSEGSRDYDFPSKPLLPIGTAVFLFQS